LARALIVGCGCRGRELGSELAGVGWEVRGTSRSREGLEAIDAADLSAAEADPDRPGTVLDLCGDVAVVVWLLGTATGEADAISAIHGPRLERLLEKLVDSPVRGFVYEAVGSVGTELLTGGREIVERAGETWRIPIAMLASGREEPGWAVRSAGAVAGLLTA
jgi:nucleoside-diphosphate-sugar epimerase